MKGLVKSIIRVCALFMCLFFLRSAFEPIATNIFDPAKQLSYTSLIQYISEDKVQSIELYSNDSDAEISLKGDKKRYTTKIPNEIVFCEYVQENISKGNDISFARVKKPGFWSFIGNCFLALIFFCIFITKEVRVEYREKIPEAKITQTSFSSVAGLKEEKAELEEVVDFLKNPQKYTAVGAQIPKGILLSGPPGTGKTLLAKAVAEEAGVYFLFASGSNFDEMYVGVGASKIRKLFDEAKQNSPAIIFIDEIDAVGEKRLGQDSSGRAQTLDQLLVEMDGVDTLSSIIVLAATNRPECLDPALMRPGRFDRVIEIHLPDVDEREAILHVHGKNKKFMEDVSFKDLAKHTAGFSGAELKNLLNEAALITVRKGQEIISKESIEEAQRKITIGLQKKGRKVSDKAKKLVAYHEAGHAIVTKFLSTQEKVKEVSIIPRGDAGGYTLHETVEDKSYSSKAELTDRLVVLLGGRAAEQIVLKDISTGASNDLMVATQTAKDMICVYGMNEDVGPISLVGTNNQLFGTETMNLIAKLITQTVKKAEKKAIEILSEHRPLLDMVAHALLERETISGEELEAIVKTYKKNHSNNV